MRLRAFTTAPFLLLALALFVAACGSDTTAAGDGDDDGEGGSGLDLDGRRFWSTSVTEGGIERDLVAGTQIEVSFDDGQIGASAGCNSMGANYSLDGDVLVVGDLFMTEIGCDQPRHEQDEFVAQFLSSDPMATLDGDRLSLSTADVTIELADLSSETETLTGTRWEVTGFIEGDAASSYAVTEPAFLEFEGDTMTGFDGCDEITAPVEVADGSTGGPVEGDGEIQFGPLSVLAPGDDCDEVTAQYRDLVHQVLSGQVSYTIENAGPGASNLTITNREGPAMTLTSR